MERKIQIRNPKLPKNPRVFDVVIDESGDRLRYEIQNIRGSIFIDEKDIKNQINKALLKKVN